MSYEIKFMNDVSHTKSIDGTLATVPFQIYQVNGASKTLVTTNLGFSKIKGAYLQSDLATAPTTGTDYPRSWTSVPSSDPTDQENTGTIWDNVYVEFDDDNSMYFMHVPFGTQNTPDVSEYITVNINGSSYNGKYNLFTGSLPAWSNAPTLVSNCNVYKHETQNYYLKAVKLHVIVETRQEQEYNTEYQEYMTVTKTYYSLSFSNTAPTNTSTSQFVVSPQSYMTWAITDASNDVKHIAVYAKQLDNNDLPLSMADYYPVSDNTNCFRDGSVSSISHLVYTMADEQDGLASISVASGQSASSSTLERTGGSIVVRTSNEVYFSLSNGDDSVTTEPNVTVIQLYEGTAPSVSLSLIGSSGSPNYTGFYQKHGRFFPSEYITVVFSAVSELGMSYEISGTGIKSSARGLSLESGMTYKHVVKISNSNGLLKEHTLGDRDLEVNLTVTDYAGYSRTATATIPHIRKLYRTYHQNLREQSSEYSHKVYYASNQTLMPETRTGTTYKRAWNEIWYPESHGSPLKADGTIDAAVAYRISNPIADTNGTNGPTDAELVKYDRLSRNANGSALATDNDGRYVQNTSLWSRTKRYPAKENSKLVNDKYETYWIIDNSGNPDFQLEFEIFDFSSTITKFPENLCARYSGDSLSVFDASAAGCVYDNPEIDEHGNKHWKLKDSTKLSHLFTLKGSGFHQDTNAPVMLDSEVNGELTLMGEGFTCPSITQCSRICIVPFTDYGTDDASRGSGFKLKAGPKHFDEFQNYEHIDETGEFWIHMSPASGGNGTWMSKDDVQIVYDYYNSVSVIDEENGTVSFSSKPLYPMLASFTHYLYLYTDEPYAGYPHKYFSAYNTGYNASETNSITAFVASQDDFVDYANKSFYVSFRGIDPVKTGTYDSSLATNDSSGRLASYRIDSDTGILRCTTDTPPRGRLFADYYYHTFYRLTSDGYGDLYFYGTGILVPASSNNSYYDWAYVDLKIINEGTNTLNSGLLTFLARGYVTKGTVVDTVLDMNRPWDVQEGTTAETVNRTGAKKEPTYAALVTNHPASRAAAFEARGSQTCVLGDIEPKGHVFVRVYWCIAANAGGTSWIDVSRGKKTYSAELSGTYMVFTS